MPVILRHFPSQPSLPSESIVRLRYSAAIIAMKLKYFPSQPSLTSVGFVQQRGLGGSDSYRKSDEADVFRPNRVSQAWALSGSVDSAVPIVIGRAMKLLFSFIVIKLNIK